LVALDQCRCQVEVPPQIFHVNWFPQDQAGKFLCPGFATTSCAALDHRSLQGHAKARDTAIGHLPNGPDIDTQGLDLARVRSMSSRVDLSLWQKEFDGMNTYLDEFGNAFLRP